MVHIVKKSKLMMDTVIEIKVVTSLSLSEVEPVIAQAFDAFRNVEQACSRFTPDSELMRACHQIRTTVQISSWLFQPLKFALEVRNGHKEYSTQLSEKQWKRMASIDII
jgi:thiamine biosynthesis lipoprotein